MKYWFKYEANSNGLDWDVYGYGNDTFGSGRWKEISFTTEREAKGYCEAKNKT